MSIPQEREAIVKELEKLTFNDDPIANLNGRVIIFLKEKNPTNQDMYTELDQAFKDRLTKFNNDHAVEVAIYKALDDKHTRADLIALENLPANPDFAFQDDLYFNEIEKKAINEVVVEIDKNASIKKKILEANDLQRAAPDIIAGFEAVQKEMLDRVSKGADKADAQNAAIDAAYTSEIESLKQKEIADGVAARVAQQAKYDEEVRKLRARQEALEVAEVTDKLELLAQELKLLQSNYIAITTTPVEREDESEEGKAETERNNEKLDELQTTLLVKYEQTEETCSEVIHTLLDDLLFTKIKAVREDMCQRINVVSKTLHAKLDALIRAAMRFAPVIVNSYDHNHIRCAVIPLSKPLPGSLYCSTGGTRRENLKEALDGKECALLTCCDLHKKDLDEITEVRLARYLHQVERGVWTLTLGNGMKLK
jgi:hypothetical protein